MPLFYHMQRKNVSAFRVGKVYNFGEQRNFHFGNLTTTELVVEVAGMDAMPIDALIKDCLDSNGFRHYRNVRDKKYTPDEKGLLACAQFTLEHQSKLLREFIFEQVRLDSFPEKPSRMKGLWLIPPDLSVLEKWRGTVQPNDYRFYELEAEGKFHVGATKWLRFGSIGAEGFRLNAMKYWSEPADPLAESAETLCEGKARVVRELKLEGASGGVWTRFKRSLSG